MPRLSWVTLAIGAMLFGFPTSASFGQTLLHTFLGDSAGDRFGMVGEAGDVDGDGHADVIVGAFLDDNTGTNSGSARVMSGADGSVLHAFDGDAAGDLFGLSVDGAGDVNGDGHADLIVGAPYALGIGNARIFSGQDGSILFTFNGDLPGETFGWSVSSAGDVNGDGSPDVIVGAWGDDIMGSDSGAAHVFSGADGSTLYTFRGNSAGDHLGWSVSDAGDVDGDGLDDVIASANWDIGPGTARVFSGADGSVLYTFVGDNNGDNFGESASGAGDVNGDGVPDLIVGANHDGTNGFRAGMARVFSGMDGSTLYTFLGNSAEDAFGGTVSGAGDVNGDGHADLLVGAWGDDDNGAESGSATVLSGADGSVLFTVNGDASGDSVGTSVSGGGDVDADGKADVVIGIALNDTAGADAGMARVYALEQTPGGDEFRRSDANGDGAFDISDPVATLFYLFQSGGVPCVLALDANDDEGVDLADAVFSLSAIFAGGEPPPSPYPGCGTDPTPGALSCLTVTCP